MNQRSLIAIAYDLPEALAVVGEIPMLGITGDSHSSPILPVFTFSQRRGRLCQGRSEERAKSGGREERAPLIEYPERDTHREGGWEV